MIIRNILPQKGNTILAIIAMIKNIIIITILTFDATFFAQDNSDSLSIEIVCKNYLEGWYNGDADRMDKALHTNFVKRRKIILKETEADLISQATASDMIEYTKAKFGLNNIDNNNINIQILDVYNDIATVKTVTDEYVDYIHLVRFNGEWKILNVLWDLKK